LEGDGGRGERPVTVFPARQEGDSLDIVWELAAQGLVRPAFESELRSGEHLKFAVTAYGEKWLKEGVQPLPADAADYVKRISKDTPDIDPIALDYAGEAMKAYTHQCYKSAVVMLGCASETLILSLLDAFIDWQQDPTKRQKLVKVRDGISIKQKHEALVQGLQDEKGKHLPKSVFDDLETWLASFFNALRKSRNDAGHPSGFSTNPDDIMAMLLVFPRYAKNLWEVRAYFVPPN